MSSDWIATACAIVACLASLALALAKTRLASSLAFALVAVFAGLTTIAAGVFGVGLALIATGAMVALLAMAAGVGEIVSVAQRPAIAPLVACAACLCALALAWPNAPALPALATASRMVAFDVGRGMDLFIALAGLVAVGGGVTALVGFGARGVFGDDKDRAS